MRRRSPPDGCARSWGRGTRLVPARRRWCSAAPLTVVQRQRLVVARLPHGGVRGRVGGEPARRARHSAGGGGSSGRETLPTRVVDARARPPVASPGAWRSRAGARAEVLGNAGPRCTAGQPPVDVPVAPRRTTYRSCPTRVSNGRKLDVDQTHGETGGVAGRRPLAAGAARARPPSRDGDARTRRVKRHRGLDAVRRRQLGFQRGQGQVGQVGQVIRRRRAAP